LSFINSFDAVVCFALVVAVVLGFNSGLLRSVGRGEGNWLAVDRDVSPIGLDCAGEYLDQGRLAGAVLAEKDVHLAREHVEVNTIERTDTRVRLG